MSIETINTVYTNSYQTTDDTENISSVDTQEFMTILLAQLQNQNPLDPVDDTEFMSQIAQMNSLQELSSIKEKMSDLVFSNDALYASNLIEKTVKVANENGEISEGIVSEYYLEDSECYLQVNSEIYPLSAILGATTTDEAVQA